MGAHGRRLPRQVRDQVHRVTGHTSHCLNDAAAGLYADEAGTHTERLIAACRRLEGEGSRPR